MMCVENRPCSSDSSVTPRKYEFLGSNRREAAFRDNKLNDEIHVNVTRVRSTATPRRQGRGPFARGPRSPPEFAEARLHTNGKPTPANSSGSRLNDRCARPHQRAVISPAGRRRPECDTVWLRTDEPPGWSKFANFSRPSPTRNRAKVAPAVPLDGFEETSRRPSCRLVRGQDSGSVRSLVLGRSLRGSRHRRNAGVVRTRGYPGQARSGTLCQADSPDLADKRGCRAGHVFIRIAAQSSDQSSSL